MSFTSVKFLFYIIAVFILYYATPKRYRYISLLLSSYVFYYYAMKGIIIYIVVTTISVFFSSLVLKKCNENISAIQGSASLEKSTKIKRKKRIINKKKMILAAVLIINFGILAALKYNRFFSSVLSIAMPELQRELFSFKNIILPLGISFYTFQSIGYLIDIYRGKYEPERNIAKFALFVSFFPQIVQGPIARYNDLAPQLIEPHHFNYSQVKNGILLIGWGFIKKLILADRMAVLVTTVFSNYNHYSGSILLTASFVYGLQVYCDFSGGMDIARGVAQVIGIHMTKNFLQPYYANSIADFWRRWHVTLGSWMRDYLFYPLSLSSIFGKLSKAIRNRWGGRWSKIIVSSTVSFIVFTVVGIWHGAEWKYVVYGLWNGGLIMAAILLEPFFNKSLAYLHIKQENWGWRIFRIIRTLLLLSVGRSIVCSTNVSSALAAIQKMVLSFSPADLVNGKLASLGISSFDFVVILILLAVVFVIDYLNEKGINVRETISKRPIVIRWAIYFAMIFALLMLIPTGGSVSGAFIYAQF